MTKSNLFHHGINFADRLQRADFMLNPFDVAKNVLLGAYLCSDLEGSLTIGKITEVEVYTGGDDKASHTYQNKRTPRTEPLFKIGGHAYVFLVYGMYHQFCVVVCDKNNPCCILIRAVEPIIGTDIMKQRRHTNDIRHLTNGPAKVCQALGIKQNLSGSDLLTGPVWICPKSDYIPQSHILARPRIGVEYAGEYALKKWRFFLKESPFISKK